MVQFHDRVWGPDVSSWQGAVDWKAVKADGASFGITKVTEGISYVNPTAAPNWQGMKDAGLARVQYHYARPARLSASEESDFFLLRMLPCEPGDIIALDLETDTRDGPFTNGAYWANSWLGKVAVQTGIRPMLYCNGGILADANQRFQDFTAMGSTYGLWLASWQEVFPKAYLPWEIVALWQFTNSAKVQGIDGFVDCNIFNGTLDQMRMYGKVKPAEKPADPFEGWTNGQFRERIGGLISAVGYMGGDLANRLVIAKGAKDWTMVQSVIDELRRVRTEQLG